MLIERLPLWYTYIFLISEIFSQNRHNWKNSTILAKIEHFWWSVMGLPPILKKMEFLSSVDLFLKKSAIFPKNGQKNCFPFGTHLFSLSLLILHPIVLKWSLYLEGVALSKFQPFLQKIANNSRKIGFSIWNSFL